LYYILLGIVGFSSVFIQASPSALVDSLMYDEQEKQYINESKYIPVGLVLLFWLIFDVAMHTFLTASTQFISKCRMLGFGFVLK